VRALTTVAFVCLAARIALSQTPLSFEVASVRLNTAFPPMGSEVQIRPEQFEATQYPLLSIISLAHGISRIEGAPEWLQTQRYDIRARAPKPSSRAEVLQMLQTLLAERFRLKARRETRTMDVYGLIVAKPDSLGPGMHPVKVDCETNQITEGPDPKIFPGSRPRCGNALVSTRMVSGPVLITRRQAAVTMKTRGRPLRRRATCVRQNWPDRNVRRGAEIHPRYAAQSVPGPPVEGTTTRRVAQGRHQAAARPRPPLRAGTGRIPRHRFDSKARLELAATRPCPAAAADRPPLAPTSQPPWTDEERLVGPRRVRKFGPTGVSQLGPSVSFERT